MQRSALEKFRRSDGTFSVHADPQNNLAYLEDSATNEPARDSNGDLIVFDLRTLVESATAARPTPT